MKMRVKRFLATILMGVMLTTSIATTSFATEISSSDIISTVTDPEETEVTDGVDVNAPEAGAGETEENTGAEENTGTEENTEAEDNTGAEENTEIEDNTVVEEPEELVKENDDEEAIVLENKTSLEASSIEQSDSQINGERQTYGIVLEPGRYITTDTKEALEQMADAMGISMNAGTNGVSAFEAQNIPVPTGVKWNHQVRKGHMQFDAVGATSGKGQTYEIEVYKDDILYETMRWYWDNSWYTQYRTIEYSVNLEESGNYKFRVREEVRSYSEGESEYQYGEWSAFSSNWKFVKPSSRLPVTSKGWWSGDSACWEPVSKAGGYRCAWTYDDGENQYSTWLWYLWDNPPATSDLGWMFDDYKVTDKYNSYFQVRALSANIEKDLNGEYSQAWHYGISEVPHWETNYDDYDNKLIQLSVPHEKDISAIEYYIYKDGKEIEHFIKTITGTPQLRDYKISVNHLIDESGAYTFKVRERDATDQASAWHTGDTFTYARPGNEIGPGRFLRWEGTVAHWGRSASWSESLYSVSLYNGEGNRIFNIYVPTNVPTNEEHFYDFKGILDTIADTSEVYFTVKPLSSDPTGGTANGKESSKCNYGTVSAPILLETDSLTIISNEYSYLDYMLPTISEHDVTWSSDDGSIVSITDPYGYYNCIQLLAHKAGTTTIRATYQEEEVATCTIEVIDMSFSEKGIALNRGELRQLTLTTNVPTEDITWKSSDTSIATVDQNGVVTAVGVRDKWNSSARISASYKQAKAYCSIYVGIPITKVSISAEKINMEVGETAYLTTTIEPKDTTADQTRYISYNTDGDVIDISAKGKNVSGNELSVSGNLMSVSGNELAITAKAEGQSNIIITIGGIIKKCLVKVTGIAFPDIKGKEMVLLTNEYKTLGDAKGFLQSELEEYAEDGQFTWKDDKISLSTFAGGDTKQFGVVYTKDGKSAEGSIPVKVITVTGIAVTAEQTTLSCAADGGNNTTTLTVVPVTKGNTEKAAYMAALLDNLGYKYAAVSSNDKVATVAESENLYTVTAKSIGKTYIDFKLQKADKTVLKNGTTTISGEQSITVVDQKLADIGINLTYNGQKIMTEDDGTYIVSGYGSADFGTVEAVVSVNSNYKLTLNSSDNTILKPGALKSTNNADTTGEWTSKLNIMGTGTVVLNAVSNDKAKTTKSITILVEDNKPKFDAAVTINKAMKDGSLFGIYPSGSNPLNVETVEISSDNFTITPIAGGDGFMISINEGQAGPVPSGKTHTVSIKDKKGIQYEGDVKITVVDKKPAITIKQQGKVNTFYSTPQGGDILSITAGDAIIEEVTLTGCDYRYDKGNNSLVPNGKITNPKKPDNEGTLTVQCKGYKPIIYDKFKIKSEYKKPKLTATATTLYPNAGITKAYLQIKDGAGDVLTFKNDEFNQITTANSRYEANLSEDGMISFELKAGRDYPTSEKVTLSIQKQGWTEALDVVPTIKKNNEEFIKFKMVPALITLNINKEYADYQKAETYITLGNSITADFTETSIKGKNDAAIKMETYIKFDVDHTTGKITARIKKEDPKPGTYTFVVTAKDPNGNEVTADLRVKLQETKTAKMVNVTSKGTIDVLNRSATSVIATTRFTGAAGKVIDVKLKGNDAHLFDAQWNEGGWGYVAITAKADASFITKYAYKVKPVFTIDTGDSQYKLEAPNDVVIKVTQVKPKTVVAAKTTTLYNTSGNNISGNIYITNKVGEILEVKNMELIEAKGYIGAFDLSWDKTNNSYTLNLKDASKVAKKSYSVNANLWLTKQGDNEKPITVTLKIAVK